MSAEDRLVETGSELSQGVFLQQHRGAQFLVTASVPLPFHKVVLWRVFRLSLHRPHQALRFVAVSSFAPSSPPSAPSLCLRSCRCGRPRDAFGHVCQTWDCRWAFRHDSGTIASSVGLSRRSSSVLHFGRRSGTGMVPQPIVDAIRLGRMTALSKPDGAVRGIVIGDVVRRLVAPNNGPAVE